MPRAAFTIAPARRRASTLTLFLALVLAPAANAGDVAALTRVADGVYVHVGPHAQASPANLGTFANAAVVVGEESVAVVDTGGSRRFGEALRAAIRGVTSLPVRYVINTHVHPDHTFGNAAFVADGVQFVGHHKLPRAMAQRGPYYLDNFARLLGPAFEGTELVPPGLLVEDALEIDLGRRRLILSAHPTAHTDNDLSVFDPASGTLFAGDLLFMERLPVVDGSLKGWIAEMQRLRAATAAGAMDVRQVVPGHGGASARWPQALDDQMRYLGVLLAGTREAVALGIGIEGAIKTVAPEEATRWKLFDDNHPRNVTASYTELEWE